jgi:hypothetical protein
MHVARPVGELSHPGSMMPADSTVPTTVLTDRDLWVRQTHRRSILFVALRALSHLNGGGGSLE